MKNPNIINSKPLGRQSYLWKQAYSDSPFRKCTWKNFWFYPIIRLPIINVTYKHKKKPSFLFDKLIIGSNPIITLILLNKLSKECILTDNYLKIGIHIPKENDYWAYDLIQNSDTFNLLQQITGINAKSIDDFVEQVCLNLSKNHIELFLIENNYSITFIKKDDFINGWILNLNKKEDTIPEVEEFIKYQNDVKNIINNKIISTLYQIELIKKISWANVSEDNHPVLLSKEVFLSSLPQGWLNCETKNTKNMVFFKHVLSDSSYGTAQCIVTNSNLFKSFCLNQLKEL